MDVGRERLVDGCISWGMDRGKDGVSGIGVGDKNSPPLSFFLAQ